MVDGGALSSTSNTHSDGDAISIATDITGQAWFAMACETPTTVNLSGEHVEARWTSSCNSCTAECVMNHEPV